MKKSHKHNSNSKEEYQKAIKFLKKGCDCGCSATLPKEKFAQLRIQFQNLSKKEQDAFVMGQLLSMDEGETTTSSRFPKRARTNLRTFYRWNNKISLCQPTYLNMLGISRDYLEDIRNLLLLDQGLVSRVHGGINRMPRWKTKMMIDDKVKKKVKKFLEKYAQEHGQPDPSQRYAKKISVEVRSSGEVILLPTYASYRSVHADFIISVGEGSNLKSLKYEAFRRLWHELVPHIKFMKPRTDLCDTYHKFKTEIHSCKDEKERASQKKNLIDTENELKSKENTTKRTRN